MPDAAIDLDGMKIPVPRPGNSGAGHVLIDNVSVVFGDGADAHVAVDDASLE